MKNQVYDRHDAAFRHVSAYAIIKDGRFLGKIAIKYPKDGAGRLTAFLHIHGVEMVAGTASGYGYDKVGAAIEAAAEKLASVDHDTSDSTAIHDAQLISGLLQDMGGRDAYAVLHDAGITLANVI